MAAALANVLPGRTASVWPPQLVAGEPESTAGQIQEAIGGFLTRQHVCLAQALLAVDSTADADRLRTDGFSHAADLLYLASSTAQFPDSSPAEAVQFEPYRLECRSRLARLVGDTYWATLDCPSLNGVRDIQDVLDGYQATGVFSPERWFFLRHRGCDVGCLLLADHPEHDQWELVYMGLTASARGHGWGLDVTRHAQRLTGQAGRSRLVLAVDAANDPAISAYAAAGFQTWDRRRVLLKLFAQ